MQKKSLVIFGDSAFAQIAYEYFTHDSNYEVKAFTVSRSAMKQDSFCGLPVVPFEELTSLYPPDRHEVFVALVYREMNRRREKFFREAKELGYRLASYVSSRAFVWRNVTYGENVFIFEDNTVQPFVTIGDNVILWSGNHIGHHSRIENHCFVASQAVISGFVKVGEGCFIGVNATIGHEVTIGARSLIGAGAMIVKDCKDKSLVRGTISKPDPDRTTDDVNL